jgi:hypothetical protein
VILRRVGVLALVVACHHDARRVGVPDQYRSPTSTGAIAPVAPPSMAPDVVIEVVGTRPCGPVRNGLAGQAAPDPVWLERLVAQPWCRGDDAGGWVREELEADGAYGTWPGVAAGGARANCWALGGDVLFVYSGVGTRWWGWRLREAGPGAIAWQGHTHQACPIVPEPGDQVITPGGGGSGSPRGGS